MTGGFRDLAKYDLELELDTNGKEAFMSVY